MPVRLAELTVFPSIVTTVNAGAGCDASEAGAADRGPVIAAHKKHPSKTTRTEHLAIFIIVISRFMFNKKASSQNAFTI